MTTVTVKMTTMTVAMTMVAMAMFFPARPAFAQTATLSSAGYLRKLSLHVRGSAPSPLEYMELKAAVSQGREPAFFQAKIAEYLATPEHANKMSFRLEELFRLKTSLLPELPSQGSGAEQAPWAARNALNSLFTSLARENLSWDTLLVGKSYQLYPRRGPFLPLGDIGFLRALVPGLPEDLVSSIGSTSASIPASTPVPDPAPIPVSFADDDPRIAGAITTARFFGRYTTTQVNKNRRRAAAVFNIFLCDPMAAAVPAPPSSPGGILDRAFPETAQITEDDIRRAKAAPDKHGADMACAQCHYKLDPMGQAFATSTVVLAPRASAGRLVYKDRETGELIDRSGRGLGDVAKAITAQKAYAHCQIDYFWRWFIGVDRPLTVQRREELAREFDRVDRRTNDFIALLLAAPEFRTRDFRAPSQVRADEVKAVFKNCMNCHGQKIGADFTRWPIGGDQTSMRLWAGRISSRLDLANGGANRDMPPDWSSWQPSADDLDLIKKWIDDGTPDENGTPQI